MALPIFHTDSKDLGLLQTNWAMQLDPVIGLPINKGHTIKMVSLVSGINMVNHGLQRSLQGWFIVRQRSAASIYDVQDTNTFQNLTLALMSSANVIVDIFVF